MRMLVLRVWRLFVPQVFEFSYDHPRVQGFVCRLDMRARFVMMYEIQDGFTSVNVRYLLPTDEMWEWVDYSAERWDWLIRSLSDRFALNESEPPIQLSIDGKGNIREVDR